MSRVRNQKWRVHRKRAPLKRKLCKVQAIDEDHDQEDELNQKIQMQTKNLLLMFKRKENS